MRLINFAGRGGGFGMFFFLLLLVLSPCEEHASSFAGNWRFLIDAASFLDECRATLTSDSVLEDGLISQNEYTSAIVQLCGLDGVECELSPNPTFSSLSLSLSLAFLGQVCAQFATTDDCIAEVVSTAAPGSEFGLDINGEDLDTRISELCSAVFSNVVVTPDTLSPTVSTPSPTILTETPSTSPSPSPTAAGGAGAVNSGPEPPPAPKGLSSSDSSLSGGAIAGIVAASAVFVFIALLLVWRRKHRKRNTRELPQAVLEVKGDESIFTENSRELYVFPNQTAGSTFDEGSDDSPEAVSRDLQSSNIENETPPLHFDPNSTGGMIVESSPGEDAEGNQGSSATSLRQKVNALDHAIDIGDWDAVYKISSTLSDKDDLSSHRSGSSTGSSTRARKRLNPTDQAKAAKLENLVELGDWEAVASMAATFSNVSSGEVSLASSIYNDSEFGADDARVGAVPRKTGSPRFDEAAAKFAELRETEDARSTGTPESTPSTPPRRSLMDFVGHGGKSPAAADALAAETETDVTGIIGASPRGNQATTGAAAAGATRASASSAASESDDEKKIRKNSWRSFFGKRGNEDYMVDNVMEGTPGLFDPDSDVTAASPDAFPHEASPRSSPISSGMSTPIDAEMAQEFERMIAANDWKGLAEMAAQEVGTGESDDGKVELRPTPKSERPEYGVRKFPSMHGAKVLIPFWEKLIDEVEAEKKAGLGSLDNQGNEVDLNNEELLGKGVGASATPVNRNEKASTAEARSHTKETYDAAAAFAKAWNNLKEDTDHEGEST